MDIISRAKWGARAPRSRSTVSWSQRREFIVHYSEGPTTQSVRSIQDFHMDGRGWADIGYNFLVDVSGRIYEGRGWLVVGAHAPDHNTSGIGVCMIGRDGDSTAAAKRSIRWLYDEAVRRAGRNLAKLGHRDVYATSCPGNQLHAWVRAGMPTDGAGRTDEGDDMPDYVSVSMGEPQEFPPRTWVTIRFDREHSDKGHHHRNAGGPSFVKGPARYSATCALRIEGLAPGTEIQARVFERADADGSTTDSGLLAEYFASNGATFLAHNVVDSVGAGDRARLEVIHYGTDTGRIVSGTVKALVWPL